MRGEKPAPEALAHPPTTRIPGTLLGRYSVTVEFVVAVTMGAGHSGRVPRDGRVSFAKVNSFGRRTDYDFAGCGPFEVYRQPLPYRSGLGPACVAFNYERVRGRLARANRRVAGSSAYLNAVFGMTAAELSAVLNERREAFHSSQAHAQPPIRATDEIRDASRTCTPDLGSANRSTT